MTDEGALFQPGTDEITVPFQPRSVYAGYKAFGGGGDAVLVEPGVARELRSAAEIATQQRRVTGGLLFGSGWVDDQGAYLVVNGFIEAGPGENSGGRLSPGGADDFTLSEAGLRLLREDTARMYSARLELGWWRTRAGLGEFGPRDLRTQAELAGPDGVGLLVYGSGTHWGTAYLGPDGRAPDSAGTLVATPGAVSEPPPDPELAPYPEPAIDHEPRLDPEPALDPEPDLVELVDISAGESMLAEPPRANAGSREPEMPADVRLVLGALAMTVVAAAIIIGVLAHSVTVALIIAAVVLLALFSAVWVSRH